MTATIIALIATLGMQPPWLGISLERTERRCVAIKLVQPDGPAWVAGLRDDDCVAEINSKKTLEPNDVVALIEAAVPPENILFVLSDGRIISIPYVPRTLAVEQKYCMFRSQKDVHIRALIWHDQENIEDLTIHLEKSVTLGEARKQLAAKGRARIVFASRCESKVPVIQDDAPDEKLLLDGADVWFGFDHIDAEMKTQRKTVPLPLRDETKRSHEGEIYYGP